MKENFKTGAKLFLKLIVVNIMCFFVVMSFSVLATAAFTKNVGYKAYTFAFTAACNTGGKLCFIHFGL